ncbi:hypothetical protein GCM10012280_32410 [Wenjunlia tyrosinilytica]|uniref:Uncharacterized protein n=1 Tax=Wenjunlia tyrosinilytica TaxID=1544741 RepID=A0A918DZ95_9ACTN|nr:hypothetical protein GCM10012280_32410 [Wenjunlia tyrosinilytica]
MRGKGTQNLRVRLVYSPLVLARGSRSPVAQMGGTAALAPRPGGRLGLMATSGQWRRVAPEALVERVETAQGRRETRARAHRCAALVSCAVGRSAAFAVGATN